MKIEYLKAKNFLCIGEEPLEIDFDTFGNIVLIKGINLDYHDSVDSNVDLKNDNTYRSNAAGKSTIACCLVYALFGSTIRHLKHGDIINNKKGKKLEVELIFSIHGKRYRILRCRKPDSLQLWEDGPPWVNASDNPDNNNELTLGGAPATQKRIESIIKMTQKTFVNVVCFGQHNDYNFLDCSPADQREIAENLLSLEVYKKYLKSAKDELKNKKDEIKLLNAEYESILDENDTFTNQLKQLDHQQNEWLKSKQYKIEQDKKRIDQLKLDLQQEDVSSLLLEYSNAQIEIPNLTNELAKRQDNITNIQEAVESGQRKLNEAREKHHQLTLEYRSLQSEVETELKKIRKHQDEIGSLQELKDGMKCPTCYGTINKQHYGHVIQVSENKIQACKDKIDSYKLKSGNIKSEIDRFQVVINNLSETCQMGEYKLRQMKEDMKSKMSKLNYLSSLKKPDMSTKQAIIDEKIKALTESISVAESEVKSGGPYVQIYRTTQEKIDLITNRIKEQKQKVEQNEKLINYYEFCVKAFGDDGIKSYLIDEITPALNARIAHWMHYLLNGRLKVTFKGDLSVTITDNKPDGKEVAYNGTCGSEKQRIKLAISQAFAHVQMLSSGTWPSLVFLDEASDSIDHQGIQDIYQTICALAAEKQVFVITHNNQLRNALSGVDTLTMLRENGYSRRYIENK